MTLRSGLTTAAGVHDTRDGALDFLALLRDADGVALTSTPLRAADIDATPRGCGLGDILSYGASFSLGSTCAIRS